LVAGLNKADVERRAGVFLEILEVWAYERGFSYEKSNTVVFKGNLDEGLEIKPSTGIINLTDKIKHLGVIVDRFRKFGAHLKCIVGKSGDLYSRLRIVTSADWGMTQVTSKIIYRTVFLPRITYASEVWGKTVKTKGAVRLLGQKQRRPLLSMMGTYKTTSTDALQIVAG